MAACYGHVSPRRTAAHRHEHVCASRYCPDRRRAVWLGTFSFPVRGLWRRRLGVQRVFWERTIGWSERSDSRNHWTVDRGYDETERSEYPGDAVALNFLGGY